MTDRWYGQESERIHCIAIDLSIPYPHNVENTLSAIHLFIQKRAVTTVIQAIHLTLMSPARLHTYTAYTVGFLAV